MGLLGKQGGATLDLTLIFSGLHQTESQNTEVSLADE